MGYSPQADIFYGIVFDECAEFPWGEYSSGLEDWWYLEIHKFKPSATPYNEEGNYKEGCRKGCSEEITYWSERKTHKESCPKLPIEVVYHGYHEDTAVALVAKLLASGSWDGPTELKPQEWEITLKEMTTFFEFLDKYKIKYSAKDFGLQMTCYYG